MQELFVFLHYFFTLLEDLTNRDILSNGFTNREDVV